MLCLSPLASGLAAASISDLDGGDVLLQNVHGPRARHVPLAWRARTADAGHKVRWRRADDDVRTVARMACQ